MDVKSEKNPVSFAVWTMGVAVLFLLLLSVKKELQASETSFGDMIKKHTMLELSDSIMQRFMPVFSFVQQGQRKRNVSLERQISNIMPLYGYLNENYTEVGNDTNAKENYLSLEDIMLAEAREEGESEHVVQADDASSLQELLRAENEAAQQMQEILSVKESATAFVRHGLQNPVDLQSLSDYETLIKNFYTIDSNTMAGSDQLNVSKLMERDLTISKESEGPQILIYHTHSQEAFSDSVPNDSNTTIVGVGARLSEILREEYGYQVLHHTGQYDVESRDDAYSQSLPAIEQVLAENPSIEVIIDLHRDSMPEETKLVMDLDGRPTARFMFFNGLSRTQKTGNIAYLYNENLEDNLAFSFQLQLKATEYYPGLTRKIYLKGYRYNMHLRPRTTLIELGAQNNTVEEAMNACDPLAHIIDMVLSQGA